MRWKIGEFIGGGEFLRVLLITSGVITSPDLVRWPPNVAGYVFIKNIKKINMSFLYALRGQKIQKNGSKRMVRESDVVTFLVNATSPIIKLKHSILLFHMNEDEDLPVNFQNYRTWACFEQGFVYFFKYCLDADRSTVWTTGLILTSDDWLYFFVLQSNPAYKFFNVKLRRFCFYHQNSTKIFLIWVNVFERSYYFYTFVETLKDPMVKLSWGSHSWLWPIFKLLFFLSL